MKYVLVFLVLIKILDAAEYTNSFTKCKLSGSDSDECLTKAIGDAFQQICTNGIPELSIPSFYPLEVPEMKLRTEGPSINLAQNYYDMKLYGYCDGKISNAHFDNDNKVLTFTFLSPKVENIGRYDFDGNILLIKIKAKGFCNQTQTDFKMDHTITFEETKKGQDTYFRIKSYNLKFSVSRVYIFLEKLFEDKLISDNILKVFNENWQALWEDTKHPLEHGHSLIYKALAERFFSSVPINQIFLD